jgi:hypothetical protein
MSSLLIDLLQQIRLEAYSDGQSKGQLFVYIKLRPRSQQLVTRTSNSHEKNTMQLFLLPLPATQAALRSFTATTTTTTTKQITKNNLEQNIMAGSNALIVSGVMTPPPTPRLQAKALPLTSNSSPAATTTTTTTTTTATNTGSTTVPPNTISAGNSNPQLSPSQLTYLESAIGWELMIGVEKAIRDA